jgi:cytoskeletal protein RodZ
MDIGGELRAARRTHQRSIEQIARATKISPAVLRAIENNAFDRVPGGLFTRGFLRAYAREVELDPEGIVERYRSEVEGVQPQPEEAARPAVQHEVDVDDLQPTAGESSPGQIIQICVIVIVVAAYFAWLRPSKPAVRPPAAATQAAAAAPVPAPAPAPAPTTPVGTTGQSDVRPMEVEVRAEGPCWVSASVDEQPVFARLMNAGEREHLTVSGQLALRVGDPSTFGFSIDGVPGRSLGRAGQPVTVKIDRQNVALFLQERPREPATGD